MKPPLINIEVNGTHLANLVYSIIPGGSRRRLFVRRLNLIARHISRGLVYTCFVIRPMFADSRLIQNKLIKFSTGPKFAVRWKYAEIHSGCHYVNSAHAHLSLSFSFRFRNTAMSLESDYTGT